VLQDCEVTTLTLQMCETQRKTKKTRWGKKNLQIGCPKEIKQLTHYKFVRKIQQKEQKILVGEYAKLQLSF